MSVATVDDQVEQEKKPRKRKIKAVAEPGQVTTTTSNGRGRGVRNMSDSHKAALAEGREQGRAVRTYLEAIEKDQAPRRRGRRRTPDSIEKRLAAIEEVVESADALTRLHLTQERIDLVEELSRMSGGSLGSVDMSELEAAFVEAAGPYSRRKGIIYAVWRAVGVQPAVLKRAGIHRS